MTQPVGSGYVNALTGEAADPWDSGVPEFEAGKGSGYISSGELMAWLAMVGGNTYSDMREQMMTTEQRAELKEELGHIKATLEKTIANNAPENFDTLENEIRALTEKYKGTIFEDKVTALFGDRLKQLEASRNARIESDAARDALAEIPYDPNDPELAAARIRSATADAAYDNAWRTVAKELDSWKTDVETKTDKLGTEEQLSLIRVQELNSRITLSTQTASNVLADQDRAKSAVVANLKG